ncbi:hypothetical protein FD754_019810 [Muntiacus muntjak]|uniref:Transcription initiation factor IIA gamma subunit C-terminal domain-containing protein n=1 Tax=Muntiacus muntjak TaxID=9888 RepID=A0A5N3V171_MUNMU|nr:hypothetical protein FD754_019810 [Muntiacus muntjak]
MNIKRTEVCKWKPHKPMTLGQRLLGSLNTYRFCDNVWTFVLNDVEFREVTELIKVDKVKIVACDGKNTGSSTTE